jgi:arsenate reductase
VPRSKQTILFICQGNDARSQMAEGMVNQALKERYEALSAGTQPTSLDQRAVKVMKEINIDIGKNKPKDVEMFYGKQFNFIVTLDDEAEEDCPCFIQGDDYIHESFPDPAKVKGSEEKVLGEYRRVRDDVRAFIKETFGAR